MTHEQSRVIENFLKFKTRTFSELEHPLFSYLPLQSANDTRWDIWKFSTQHPHSATGVWGLSDYGIFVLKFALYLFLRNKSLKLSKKILQISPFSPKSQAHPAIPLFHFLNLKIPESAESGKITQKWQPWPSTIQSFLKNMLFSQFKKKHSRFQALVIQYQQDCTAQLISLFFYSFQFFNQSSVSTVSQSVTLV